MCNTDENTSCFMSSFPCPISMISVLFNSFFLFILEKSTLENGRRLGVEAGTLSWAYYIISPLQSCGKTQPSFSSPTSFRRRQCHRDAMIASLPGRTTILIMIHCSMWAVFFKRMTSIKQTGEAFIKYPETKGREV